MNALLHLSPSLSVRHKCNSSLYYFNSLTVVESTKASSSSASVPVPSAADPSPRIGEPTHCAGADPGGGNAEPIPPSQLLDTSARVSAQVHAEMRVLVSLGKSLFKSVIP